MNKKGLGKGLGAIFGDAADPVNTAVEPVRSDEEKKELLLKDIVPNPISRGRVLMQRNWQN